ncbi:MAG TPA: aspartate kinase [Candidatus Kapabacteria bacterium]|nr:aspartate kinase [Candidatus Kapabacteria bacterium]
MSSIVVQKFGGTSVQDAPAMRRAIDIVAEHGIKRGVRPLVVLSACAGVTNSLIRIGELALLGKFDEAHKIISALDERHFTIVRDLTLGTRAEQESALELRFIWRELRTLVRGIELLGELTPRMKDKLLSAGERASTAIFAHAIREYLTGRGIGAQLCDAKDFFITDSSFTRARPQIPEITKQMKPLVKKMLSGTVCITQGFIGSTKRGETTTIGRGGSDFSATIMGVASGAKEIQIWTDVAGIYTCDPRIVPEAYAQQVVNFADASAMAFYGAKVLHPETIGPAVEAGIPVRVLSSKEPEQSGTTIVMSTTDAEPLTGIAVMRNVSLVQIRSGELVPSTTMLPLVFDTLSEKKIVPLVTSLSFDNALLALASEQEVRELQTSLTGLADIEVLHEQALVTLIGHGLEHSSGVASRLFSAVKKVNCEMISYGGAPNALSIIIPESVVERAVKRIHNEFFSV